MNRQEIRAGSAPRFYVPGPISAGAVLWLPEHTAHHAQRVLRMNTGDAVRVFCGDGTEWAGELASAHKSG